MCKTYYFQVTDASGTHIAEVEVYESGWFNPKPLFNATKLVHRTYGVANVQLINC